MLASAREALRSQDRLAALAEASMRRKAGRGAKSLVATLTAYQLAAIEAALSANESMLDEQDLVAPGAADIVPLSLVSGQAAVPLYEKAGSRAGMLTRTLIANAFSTASTVDVARRPQLTGYVRILTPPSCSRCAVLAGRVYKYSQSFQRHPQCNCLMQPSSASIAHNFTTDPEQAVEAGQVRGLSKADMEALKLGADLGRIVNVRQKAAGLYDGSSVIARVGNLTPAGILRVASDRAQTVELLERFGYITR